MYGMTEYWDSLADLGLWGPGTAYWQLHQFLSAHRKFTITCIVLHNGRLSIGSHHSFEEVILLQIGEFVYCTPGSAMQRTFVRPVIELLPPYIFLSHDCDSFWRSHFTIIKFRWRYEWEGGHGGQPRPKVSGAVWLYVYTYVVYRHLSASSVDFALFMNRNWNMSIIWFTIFVTAICHYHLRGLSCLVSTGRSQWILEWWLRKLRSLRLSCQSVLEPGNEARLLIFPSDGYFESASARILRRWNLWRWRRWSRWPSGRGRKYLLQRLAFDCSRWKNKPRKKQVAKKYGRKHLQHCLLVTF